MKTLKFIGMALFAVLMCVNFASCNNDGILDEPQEPEIINISLNCTGEILDIQNSPLSRTEMEVSDLYGVQVNTITDKGTTPYAYGIFTSLENVSIGLLQGNKYDIIISMVVKGNDDVFDFSGHENEEESLNKFTYSTYYFLRLDEIGYAKSFSYDRFYGILNSYSPSANATADIEMKRVSYGAKFIAKNLTEGSLNIDVEGEYSVRLTNEITEHEDIYTLENIAKAYDVEEFSESKDITITWIKSDDTTIPIGTYTVTFKRNMLTTITIKAEQLELTNTLKVTKEETEMDNGGEYLIEGGELTDVTITDK